jgi:hypothetical protein
MVNGGVYMTFLSFSHNSVCIYHDIIDIPKKLVFAMDTMIILVG